MRTQIIAGHEIKLESGQRYLATRPIAERGRDVYPVTIVTLDEEMAVQRVIGGLSYDEANDFINQFNNQVISLQGRRW